MKEKEIMDDRKEEDITEREIDRRNAVFWYFLGVTTSSMLFIIMLLLRMSGF